MLVWAAAEVSTFCQVEPNFNRFLLTFGILDDLFLNVEND